MFPIKSNICILNNFYNLFVYVAEEKFENLKKCIKYLNIFPSPKRIMLTYRF